MKKREGNFKLILDLHGKRCDPIKSVNINLGFFSIAMKRHYDKGTYTRKSWGLSYSFRGLVHHHHDRVPGSGQAGMALELELRVPCLSANTMQSGAWSPNWEWDGLF